MRAYRMFEWKQPAKLLDVEKHEPEAGQVRLKVA
jgi:D-arabinose 1-dehydrogenase-like Zn-dependent alcohol dehydrogenase